MEEILPVNIAEGAGAKTFMQQESNDAHAASFRFELFTGKIFSIHSSPGTTMQGLRARRGDARLHMRPDAAKRNGVHRSEAGLERGSSDGLTFELRWPL